MATIVDRPSGFSVGAAHHARNPEWVRPPHHTRHARTSRPVRHAGRRRRYVLRDLALALLAVAAAAGVVVGLLHLDPTMRAEVLDLLREARADVAVRLDARGWLAGLPWEGWF
ncbi:hypothetical protein Cfla_3200 [Cellulomonas flavigena DSM 20109]|uniref:Uncharacterized protein n=1 Tax=Cellulomonas flavigena (strain ATCC 482 / DSM 20109 / BCRC 11376 / JCM 18109 / NBRC 3775 / NCIMB 8073 / NRS 134) TaxID=446466 RepID=D5ULX6_CELFN|nr:hypothetical protein [Cellulomonas flavigena]ADG76082.1 hypothetical protein Cfla_3200 [Cellulomonas flavigena DSM 20109]